MKCLYISHDGMTDPLGSSQIIPYVIGLSKAGHPMHILSCEKADRFKTHGKTIQALLDSNSISWSPIAYHRKPPVLSTIWDLIQFWRMANRLHTKERFDVIHCRSYPPSLIGLGMRKKYKTKFIFDMRGFWADERVDGKLWNIKNPIYSAIYSFFKEKEKQFLENADAVVALTHSAKIEIEKWGFRRKERFDLNIIPCCADLEHFSPLRFHTGEKEKIRKNLHINADDLVVTYLGSIGTWYMLDEMLALFVQLVQAHPKARLLFITPDDPEKIKTAALEKGIAPENLRITSAGRIDVPRLLSVTHLGLFFIRPSFSKKASSPTKLGELLSMGIPVIANAGVGDNDWLFSKSRIGHLLEGFEQRDFDQAIKNLPEILSLDPNGIRQAAQDYFSLERGIDHYRQIYKRVSELRVDT